MALRQAEILHLTENMAPTGLHFRHSAYVGLSAGFCIPPQGKLAFQSKLASPIKPVMLVCTLQSVFPPGKPVSIFVLA